jgi:hypothetical protein
MLKRYEVKLNYKGQIHTFYRHAKSEASALNYAVRALEKILELLPKALTSEFKKDVRNRELKEV